MGNNLSSLPERRSCPVPVPEGTGSACHRTFGLLVPGTHGCTADGKDELSLQIPTPVCEGVQLRRGLPTMKDRAMQALYLMALDPVSETTADSNSYGFRKERSTADAIAQSFIILSHNTSAQWILEADIKGCFDHISHDWLLNNIPMDEVMLKKWLKSGFVFNKELFPTEEGTPQGGIISPTLANMTLDGLQTMLALRFRKRGISKKNSCL